MGWAPAACQANDQQGKYVSHTVCATGPRFSGKQSGLCPLSHGVDSFVEVDSKQDK